MALVHESLYGSEQLDRVDFKEYASKLAGDIASAYDASSRQLTVSVDADTVELGLNSAIPCGLILNELISNALKYGFPDNGPG
jgi:two-component sensor histidine kinase